MRRIRSGAAVIASLALGASVTAPAAAFSPAPDAAYMNVQVQVSNYSLGDFSGFGGTISCSGVPGAPDSLGFGVGPVSMESGPIELPVGATCAVTEFAGGDPGNVGQWGEWSVQPDQPLTLEAGQVTTLTVTIERWYTGAQPEWDSSAWYPFETFTVDRVYLNRYGGVSAEGLVWCPSLAASPAGAIIGINWDATQYLGRRTAIHGSYGSDIGKLCFDPQNPTTPVRWQSLHPGGQGAVTGWVYGIDGKFGSGTIRIDADGYNRMEVVTQAWDPGRTDYDASCSTNPRADGWYDSNGDGFCAFSIEAGQRATANVKTTSVKTR